MLPASQFIRLGWSLGQAKMHILQNNSWYQTHKLFRIRLNPRSIPYLRVHIKGQMWYISPIDIFRKNCHSAIILVCFKLSHKRKCQLFYANSCSSLISMILILNYMSPSYFERWLLYKLKWWICPNMVNLTFLTFPHIAL